MGFWKQNVNQLITSNGFTPHGSFRDYLADYQAKAKNHEIDTLVALLGVDKAKLVALMNTHVTPANLNEFGRFDDLRETVDPQKAKTYFEGTEGATLAMFRIKIKAANLLRDFLLRDGVALKKNDT